MSVFKKIKASETLFINELSKKLEAEGRKLYKFGFGQSPFSPPDEIIQTLKDSAGKHDYLPVQGLYELREAVAYYHKKINQREISPENIFIGPGSKILIYAILAAFREAELFLPAPTWVSYKPQADLCKHRTHYIDTHYEENWRLSAENLRNFLVKTQLRRETNLPSIAQDLLEYAYDAKSKPKLLILTYPGNPDGMSHSKDELKEIAEVCKEYNILVISDEIYGQLTHSNKHASLIDFYPEGTIMTGGLSKMCGAGGWRLGTAILPDPEISIHPLLKQTLIGIASELYSSTTTPVQHAGITAYKYLADQPGFLEKQRKILSALGNHCAEELSKAGIKVHKPQGGFYLFPDFSPFKDKLAAKGIQSSIDLCDKLLSEAGVVVLPAAAFGHSPDLLAVRLSYVNFDGKAALENCPDGNIDTNWLQEYCPDTLEGISKLNEWLKS